MSARPAACYMQQPPLMKPAVHPLGSFEDMRMALGVELRQINLQRQQQDEKFAMLEQQMANLSQQVAAVPLQLERSLQVHQACVAQQIRESSSRSRPPSRGLDGLNLMGSTSGSSQRESPQSHKGGSGSECSEDGGRSMLANDALSEHASSFAKRFGNLSTTDTRRLLTRLEPSGANRWCNEFIESIRDINPKAADMLELKDDDWELEVAAPDGIVKEMDRWIWGAGLEDDGLLEPHSRSSS